MYLLMLLVFLNCWVTLGTAAHKLHHTKLEFLFKKKKLFFGGAITFFILRRDTQKSKEKKTEPLGDYDFQWMNEWMNN